MWLRYNPQVILVTVFEVELSLSSSIIYNKVNGKGYFVGALPPTVLYRFF